MFEYLSVVQEYDLSQKTKFFMRGRHAGFIDKTYAALVARERPAFFTLRADGLELLTVDGDGITAALQTGFELIKAAGGHSIGSPDEFMAVSMDLDPAKPDAKRLRNNHFFGLPFYGVHVNLYSRIGDTVKFWLAKRSDKVFTYKGCWDIAIGGGLTYGYTPLQAACKEAYEEAGVDVELQKHMKLAAIVDQTFDSLYTHGLHLDHQFYYDLEVPDSFVPAPVDGETEGFVSLTADEAWVVLQDGKNWKHNAAITVLDFGLRHGLFDPPADVRQHIQNCLHQPLPLDGTPAIWPLDETAA